MIQVVRIVIILNLKLFFLWLDCYPYIARWSDFVSTIHGNFTKANIKWTTAAAALEAAFTGYSEKIIQ